MRVECSKQLMRDYPVGTKFRIKAKLTDREDGGEFLYSYFGWKFEDRREPRPPAGPRQERPASSPSTPNAMPKKSASA